MSSSNAGPATQRADWYGLLLLNGFELVYTACARPAHRAHEAAEARFPLHFQLQFQAGPEQSLNVDTTPLPHVTSQTIIMIK